MFLTVSSGNCHSLFHIDDTSPSMLFKFYIKSSSVHSLLALVLMDKLTWLHWDKHQILEFSNVIVMLDI